MLTQIKLALARTRTLEEYQEHFQACQQQTVRMKELLISLLDLARSDFGELELNLEQQDLGELILECSDWLEPLAQEQEVSLETSLSPTVASVDGIRICQALTNIIANDIHHSHTGHSVSISLTQSNKNACISISDTGPGIPQETLPHIFERFYRSSKSRSSSEGSVGLGLAIASSIIKQHGGSINAANGGKGAIFTINLPVETK